MLLLHLDRVSVNLEIKHAVEAQTFSLCLLAVQLTISSEIDGTIEGKKIYYERL